MKCVMTTSLLVSTGAKSNAATLPCFDDVGSTDEKLLIVSALTNSRCMKSGVSRARNSTISQVLYAGALSCRNV